MLGYYYFSRVKGFESQLIINDLCKTGFWILF